MKSTTIYFALIFIQCISNINGDTDYIPITLDEFLTVKNSLDFTGKVALISGSSSGIGAATAQLFSFLGAQVVVTGRNETRINEVVNDCWKLSPHHIKPLGIRLDLSIPGNVAKLVNETIRAYRKIDILVNNAGIGLFATIQDPNYNDVYNQLRAINEDAYRELTRLSVPYLKITNGTIIFTTSIFARNPVISTSGYSMGKNAIIAFADTLTHDLGPNIRVNVIRYIYAIFDTIPAIESSHNVVTVKRQRDVYDNVISVDVPGVVDGTRIFRLITPPPRPILIANTIASNSLRRAGVPLDIAKTIVFLASPLSGFINGKELQLDGGAYIPIL